LRGKKRSKVEDDLQLRGITSYIPLLKTLNRPRGGTLKKRLIFYTPKWGSSQLITIIDVLEKNKKNSKGNLEEHRGASGSATSGRGRKKRK